MLSKKLVKCSACNEGQTHVSNCDYTKSYEARIKKKSREDAIKKERRRISKGIVKLAKHCHIGDEFNMSFPQRDEWVNDKEVHEIINEKESAGKGTRTGVSKELGVNANATASDSGGLKTPAPMITKKPAPRHLSEDKCLCDFHPASSCKEANCPCKLNTPRHTSDIKYEELPPAERKLLLEALGFNLAKLKCQNCRKDTNAVVCGIMPSVETNARATIICDSVLCVSWYIGLEEKGK